MGCLASERVTKYFSCRKTDRDVVLGQIFDDFLEEFSGFIDGILFVLWRKFVPSNKVHDIYNAELFMSVTCMM